MLLPDIPIYSPVQQIHHPVMAERGLNLFIKRDDLIHPLVSGNKWRKLKYQLQKAQIEQKDHIVTFGGAYSNHLLATATAAAMFGLRSTGFVRGEAVDNDHLFLCRLHGMDLIFTSRESYRDKTALFGRDFGSDARAFFVDEGGASAEGVQGCAEIVDELDQVYDHIFCASGTGTTVAGILNGLDRHRLKTLVHAIPVLKDGGTIAESIDKYLQKSIPYQLHPNYHFGGYAKTDKCLIDFMKDFILTTGILIDPVYTGKMMYALFDLAQNDFFTPGTNILAIHTGGIFGLLGMKSKFQPRQG